MTNTKKAIGQRTYETQILADRLKQLKPSELITYDELAKLASMDVRPHSNGYGRLMSARRIAETECNFLLGVVAGEGIKRLEVEEQAAIAPNQLKTMRRRNRRALVRMSRVEYEKFTEQQRAEHNLTASVMGCVDLFTRPKSVEKLAGAVQQAAAKLPIGDTLKLFSANGNGK